MSACGGVNTLMAFPCVKLPVLSGALGRLARTLGLSTPNPQEIAVPTPKQRAIANLRFVRGLTDKLVAGIPDAQSTFQTTPTENHLAWTLGHLAISNMWFTSLVTGRKAHMPESYESLFGSKSTPKSDPKVYPPLAELKQHHAAQFEALINALEANADDAMTKLCVEDSGGFAKDMQDVADRAAWHEGWHAGQLSASRRALGLPPVM